MCFGQVSPNTGNLEALHHRNIMVLVIGGRDFVIPLKAIYTWYISCIYCQVGDYMLPTTIYKNLKHRLTTSSVFFRIFGISSGLSGFISDEPCCLGVPSLKLTFSPLKMDGWNTIVSFWGPDYFQGLWLLVSGSVSHLSLVSD